ncbi:cingulin-like [Sinocyclocheilus anshuiensis]|uniref:cingulin-like n=1 Tax=Sinocyclocheilus anshuiensis TaxID=1608454 RepID=UPI0007B9F7DC|nr:PREDICTED: cingulin-like [Sinocyclocheilus anshuiensis]
MSAPVSGRKTPVDHGVQIRFINDLQDTGGGVSGQPRKEAPKKLPSRYGVAVRVQGIGGQHYVVLKEGLKGDSYGVQLRTQPPAYSSLPRRREDGVIQGPYFSSGENTALRRAQSHGSLLDRENGSEDFTDQLRRPLGDGRSGSYGNLDGGIGMGAERERPRERMERNQWGGSYQTGLNGTLGRGRGGGSHYTSSESVEISPHNQHIHSQSAVHSIRQMPAHRLSDRFDGSSAAQAGNTGTNTRGRYPIPSADDRPISTSQLPAASFFPNTYSSLRSSSPASAYSSLGRGTSSVAKVTAVSSSAPVDGHVTPDLLMDQGQSSGSEFSTEDQIQQIIYDVLNQGSTEGDAVIKHRVRVICNKIQGLKVNRSDDSLKEELEKCLDENVQLQEQLGRKNTELHQTHSELTQLRMDRENAESHVRELEDQLAGLQEELRRETVNKAQADTMHMELMAVRGELAEAAALCQKQEDILRQRERELTALKGALKDEVSTHDKEIEALREQYSQDMERLRTSMEQVSQSQATIEAERHRVNSTVRSLQQQLEESRDEGNHWREQFQSSREELRNTKQDGQRVQPKAELLQARMEKEEFEEELKDLQEKVNTMKQQIPDPKQTQTVSQELERCRADLQKAQTDMDKLKTDLDKKTMEIVLLKKSKQELEAEQKYETDRLKDQSRRDREELTKAHERAKQLAEPSLVEALRKELSDMQEEVGRMRSQLLSTEEDLQTERDKLCSAQTQANHLAHEHKELEETNMRMKERIIRLESQLQERTSQSIEAEQEQQEETKKLRQQLEESRRENSRLGLERDELTRNLEQKEKDRDSVRKENAQLEDQKRQQERALDKLSKEIERLSAASREEVRLLQAQLDEQKEKGRKEQQDSHKNAKEKLGELERAQSTIHSLQEELARQKKELFSSYEDRDNALLDKELLTNRLKHLESEIETQRTTQNDRSREIRSLEDKIKHLQLELDEEKNNAEMLTERITRSRDQIEQLRAELMQERSSKQDLELDKNALERQIKDYKSRVAEMEGQSRSSTGVSQLESKIQDLEERLRAEEREKSSVVSSQRRLERKLKELNITLDEERQQHTEQRDQLTLRVKALKRQVDEGEAEAERLDGLRRKAIREMEEMQEQKEAMQSKVTALENELKRKIQQARQSALESSVLSSDDDDDDGLYDHSSITSILTESNLQTSSC